MRNTSEHLALPRCAIRLPRVCELTSASRATIWRLVKSDQTFPKPFHISAAITCWHEGEIIDWVSKKMALRTSSASTSRNRRQA